VREEVPKTPTVMEPPASDSALLPPEPDPEKQTVPPIRAAYTLSSDAIASVVLSPTSSVNIEADTSFTRLQTELMVREEQLANKSQQLTELQSMYETQEQELRQKIQETKDEAKKRITKARERCEAAETKLQQQATSKNETVAQKEQMIEALREEGQSLAKKQSEMERAVRAAKGEARELSEQVEDKEAANKQALEKITKLEGELKSTKDYLTAARKGESLSEKLENDLLAARSDAEIKGATIMSLEQQMKELKAEAKELREEVGTSQKLATQEANQESKKVRREHTGVIEDLETKLRTSEREAGVREDALRHEVSELRKRWQDAVRRADGKCICICICKRVVSIFLDGLLIFDLPNFNPPSIEYGCPVKYGSTTTTIGKHGATKQSSSGGVGRTGKQIAI
jgi:chromosome segregation ATPase